MKIILLNHDFSCIPNVGFLNIHPEVTIPRRLSDELTRREMNDASLEKQDSYLCDHGKESNHENHNQNISCFRSRLGDVQSACNHFGTRRTAIQNLECRRLL